MQSSLLNYKATSTESIANGGGFSWHVDDARPGLLCAIASGRGVDEAFAGESGGFRYQRIPPTERGGRVHTSTITVAVFDGPRLSRSTVAIGPRDVEETVYRASGKGGQNRNKVATAVRLIHRPSGIIITATRERSQDDNRRVAWKTLHERLDNMAETQARSEEAASRKNQVGSGERADKRRTIAIQRDDVIDHVTGWRTTYKKYSKGEW